MDRRRFVQGLGWTTLGVAVVSELGAASMPAVRAGGVGRSTKNQDRRPNLLIVHTDQQSCWTIGAYGGTLIDTPHIDLLARDGAILTNFFTNSAVCTPSRGCLLTGRYPHAHGAYRNNIELNRDEVTFAEVLRRAGYATGYAGKWHLDGPPKPGWVAPERSMGFADCRYMFNRGHWKKIVEIDGRQPQVMPYRQIGDERTYTTDWLTRKTIAFIEAHRTEPFCFMVSIPDPHPPYTVRSPYDTVVQPDRMPLPATFNQTKLPNWARRQAPRDPDRLRAMKARYCGEVKLIDDCLGRILTCLDKYGLREDTVVVFTTDHGEYMGEHGLMGKNQLYETAYRIPMLIRYPRRIRPGTRIDRLVATVDFQSTVLNLMGLAPCGREQGRDASALLCGQEGPWEDVVFLHHATHDRAGLFTDRWELVFVREGDSILFDRKNDPDQVHNRFHDPACRDVVRRLGRQVLAHFNAIGAPAATWLNDMRLDG